MKAEILLPQSRMIPCLKEVDEENKMRQKHRRANEGEVNRTGFEC